jgi:hypothetical protein
MIPSAKTRTLVNRSSVVRGGGRHKEDVGDREEQANSGGLLYGSLEGLLRLKTVSETQGNPQ